MYNLTQSRLTPVIKSGGHKLEVNETVCFFSNHGLDLHIPIQSAGLLTFDAQMQFRFSYDNSNKIRFESTVEMGGSILRLNLINFTNPLPSGVTDPIPLTIGASKFNLIFNGSALKVKERVYLITLHISIFSGDLNE